MNFITPPYAHIKVDPISNAGGPLTKVIGGFPGIQGAGVTGMHGCGVRIPPAAAVAAATAGLDNVVHSPNGKILAIGTLSIIVATNRLFCSTNGPLGMTFKIDGARPKLHLIQLLAV